jgi:hypothetical protein
MPAEEPRRRGTLRAQLLDPLLGKGQGLVLNDFDEVPVVEAGAAYCMLVDPKAEPPDQVKRTQGRRTEARDVAGIGRNFWFDQNNVEGSRDSACA